MIQYLFYFIIELHTYINLCFNLFKTLNPYNPSHWGMNNVYMELDSIFELSFNVFNFEKMC
jgi:hypothetical protein